MDEIKKQVIRARRRMLLGGFFRALCWFLFAGLLVAAVALAIPKIWQLPFLITDADHQIWFISWTMGGAVAACLGAIIWAFLHRAGMLQTAVEVDERFKLKERLSSALSLSDRERDSKAGLALVKDAAGRAETIDVRDRFQLAPNRQALLPLLPAALLLILFFLPNAVAADPVKDLQAEKDNQVKVAIEEAKKKLKEKINEMETKGLKDAKADLKSLEKKIDNLSKDSTDDKRDALVKLNDVKKQLEEQARKLGGDSSEMKKQLNQLQDVSKGPAKQLAEALSNGEFEEAKKAIKELVEKLQNGKMSDVEKQQLAKDLDKLAEQIEKMAEEHEKAKQELKDKIKKALEQGDLAKAAQLQQQLEKKEQQDQQMKKMQKMAEQVKQCAECMKQGNGQPKQGQNGQQQNQQQGNQGGQQALKDAIKSLEEMGEQMDELQKDMGQLEDLEDMMEQIEQAKNACNGCEGQKDAPPKWQDWAKGGGRGAGLREKEEEDTGSYKSRVKGKVQQGETVVTGNADGNNITGKSVSEVREMVKSSISKKSDPLENQKLPRAQREHARQYFEKLGDQ